MKIEFSKKTLGIILVASGIITEVHGLLISNSSGDNLKNIGIGVLFIIIGVYVINKPNTKKK